MVKTPPPPPPPTPRRIETEVRQSTESELHKGNGKIGQNLDGQTHGSGARYGVGRRGGGVSICVAIPSRRSQ